MLENTPYWFKALPTLTTLTLTMAGRNISPTGVRKSRTSMLTWLSEKSSDGSGNGLSSKSSPKGYSHGRMVIRQDRRKCSGPRTMTGLPGGGYGDRRYMLVWGTTHEDHGILRFEPEKVSEWDEKILPFHQYCTKSAPQGAKYLGRLQASVEV